MTIEGWVYLGDDWWRWRNDPARVGLRADVVLTMGDIPELTQRMTSAQNGYFFFRPEGGAGAYTVRLVVPDGYAATTPTERTVDWLGETVRNVNFGLARK